MLEYTNSKCQASLIYITKCHTEQDVATCLLKASETKYKPVNQTNLRAYVLIALVDTSGPPLPFRQISICPGIGRAIHNGLSKGLIK